MITDFQHAYSVPHRGSDLECLDPSLAQQSFKDETDINVLLERFKVTGVLPQGVAMPTFGDFTGISDYRTAVDAITKASNAFMDMPANVRNRFDNDPQKFLEFCSDDKNRDEAIRLGLVPAPVVSDAPASAPGGGIGGVAPDVRPVRAVACRQAPWVSSEALFFVLRPEAPA